MNERIKQLAEQAYELCGKHSNDYNGPAFTEKFAELIIRECADVATINSNQWHSAGRFVLTHFGIE